MVPQGKIIPNHKEINFGAISIGSETQQVLIFRNMSKNGALFHIKSKIEGLSIMPMYGRLGPNDKLEIQFKIDTSYPSILKDEITIDVRGSKSFQIPIIAEILVPNVNISVDSID